MCPNGKTVRVAPDDCVRVGVYSMIGGVLWPDNNVMSLKCDSIRFVDEKRTCTAHDHRPGHKDAELLIQMGVSISDED